MIIIKLIVTVFFLVIAAILIVLWSIIGTILLPAVLIRVIALYTMSLLNSFVSGGTSNHDYSKAIDDVLKMYLNGFIRIIKLPSYPWITTEDTEHVSFKSLLPSEVSEIKKSWLITMLVFLSYTISFGVSLAFLFYRENLKKEDFIQMQLDYETRIANLENQKKNLRDSLNITSKQFKQTSEQFKQTSEQFIKQVGGIKHKIGKHKFTEGGYDKGYKMFFEVKQPIVLKDVMVYPKSKGKVTLKLSSLDGQLVNSKDTNLLYEKKPNVINLNFRINKPGKYYLNYTGDILLWYDSKGINYSKYASDAIKLTGCGKTQADFNKTKYYQYFYDWSYSLLLDL